jgi:hypothetical protein
MNAEDARATLEVGPDATADDVRRAYTRLVKKHKPDRDPDGFRRVREAYEALSNATPARAAVEALTPAATSDLASDPPPAADEALIAARRELAQMLANARGSALALRALRAHLETYPTDDGARLAAMAELEGEGDHDASAALARRGADVGGDRILFLRELVLRKPTEIRTDEIERLRASPETAPLATMALIAHGRIEDAQTVAFDALAANALVAAAAARARIDWLRAVAATYEHGAAPLARALMRELDRRLPGDARFGDENARVVSLLLRELGDVAGEIERPLAAALGTFIRRPVLGAARVDAALSNATRMEKDVAVLTARAPTLRSLVASHFMQRGVRGPAPPANDASSILVRVLGFFVVAIVVSSVRACMPTGDPPPPRVELPRATTIRGGP